MRIRGTSHRKRGLSIIFLAVVFGCFAILPLGLLIWDLQRAELAREELRSVCESAALAGSAVLAGSDFNDPLQAHQNAINVAVDFFRANSVIGYPLTTAYVAGSLGQVPSKTNSNLYIEFLDPHNNLQPVPVGDVRGKVLRLTSTLNIVPAFGSFLGINSFPLSAIASGGVPALDVVLCFDVSGSIDDQTPVTFVRRQWSTTLNKTQYIVLPARTGAPAGASASGKLYEVLGPPPTGSRTNATSPQWLSISNQSDHRYPLSFSEEGSASGLRGTPNTGTPPGNCPPGRATTGDSYTYTDLVVNLDGNSQFAGISKDGFNFPDLATVVEASRGNLENSTVFSSSKANLSLTGITPRSGYQAQYLKMAHAQLEPIGAAQDAASQFVTIINTNTDAHFGFVPFAEFAGKSQGDYVTQANVDGSYSAGGTAQFPMPEIELNPLLAVTNFETVKAVIPTVGANTATNIGDALYEAARQLKSKTRKGAKKAIVLFTDGQPTVGGPLSSDPWTNARQAAVIAKQAGIPIYTIGLAQNAEIVPSETAILNDTNSDPMSGGIAAIAGGGGRFFLVTNAGDLRLTFENVARHLVQLIR